MNNVMTPVEKRIGPAALSRALKNDQRAVLLDVRTPGEFAGAHIAGARLVPLADLRARELLAGLDDSAALYVVCQSGQRARKAIEAFEAEGFDNAVLVEGGVDGWAA